MHGSLTFMSPGLIATAVEVLDAGELAHGLKVPDYPVLAYELIPRGNDVDSWKTNGPKHFIEKYPLKQTRMHPKK